MRGLALWLDGLIVLVLLEVALRVGAPPLLRSTHEPHDLLPHVRYAAFAQHLDRDRPLHDPTRRHGASSKLATTVWLLGGVAPTDKDRHRVAQFAEQLVPSNGLHAVLDLTQTGHVLRQSFATAYELLRDAPQRPTRIVVLAGVFDFGTPWLGQPVLSDTIADMVEVTPGDPAFRRAFATATFKLPVVLDHAVNIVVQPARTGTFDALPFTVRRAGDDTQADGAWIARDADRQVRHFLAVCADFQVACEIWWDGDAGRRSGWDEALPYLAHHAGPAASVTARRDAARAVRLISAAQVAPDKVYP